MDASIPLTATYSPALCYDAPTVVLFLADVDGRVPSALHDDS